MKVTLYSVTSKRKRCSCCGETKPLPAFGRNRQSKDGLHYYCKPCAAARQRRWAKQNPDIVRQMQSAYLERVRAQNAERDPYDTPVTAVA